jgi:hypothetical protein
MKTEGGVACLVEVSSEIISAAWKGRIVAHPASDLFAVTVAVAWKAKIAAHSVSGKFR